MVAQSVEVGSPLRANFVLSFTIGVYVKYSHLSSLALVSKLAYSSPFFGWILR